LSFEKQYFRNRKHFSRVCIIKRCFLDVLRWASRNSEVDFLKKEGKIAIGLGRGYKHEEEIVAYLEQLLIAWVFGFSWLLQKKASSILGTKKRRESS